MRTNSQPLDAAADLEKALHVLRINGATMHEHRHSGRCECGECNAIIGYADGMERVGFVLVCESCGDNDSFELLNK